MQYKVGWLIIKVIIFVCINYFVILYIKLQNKNNNKNRNE